MVARLHGRRPSPSEEAIAVFCDEVVNDHWPLQAVLRHPLRSISIWRAIAQLRGLSCTLEGHEQGFFRVVLHRPAPWPIRDLLALRSVLSIPGAQGSYEQGSGRQTLRRKMRVAERAGVVVEEVRDLEARRHLLDLTIEREKAHPNATYRNAEPELTHLLDVDLWLLARTSDGRPLLLAVTPVTHAWGLLSYFRTLEDGDVASAARYLTTAHLVEHLRRRGVRHLLDPASPFRLPSGLRHFQRMLGYRLARVRISRSRSAPAA